MKPKQALIACALSAACGSAFAAAAEAPPAGGGATAGFFAVPVRPLAYSFADICSLTIEPKPAPVRTAAGGALAAPGLAAVWSQADKPQPAGGVATASAATAVAAEADAPAAPPQASGSAASPPLAWVPEPAGWMQLCGIVIVALIAKRRRDWSAWRGLAFGARAPLRPRAAERETHLPS